MAALRKVAHTDHPAPLAPFGCVGRASLAHCLAVARRERTALPFLRSANLQRVDRRASQDQAQIRINDREVAVVICRPGTCAGAVDGVRPGAERTRETQRTGEDRPTQLLVAGVA